MKGLIGLGVVFGLTAIAYLNRHSYYAPAIMMVVVFPVVLGALFYVPLGDYHDD